MGSGTGKYSEPLMEQQQQMAEPAVELSLIDSLMYEMKSILTVAIICILISLPQVAKLLSKVLPNRAFIINNLEYVIVLVKGIIGGILFFLANKMV